MKESVTNMTDTTLQNFAFEDGNVKLFPLLAVNPDGTINKLETMLLIQAAGRTFGAQSLKIPSERIADVLSQIEGAAQSHGFVLAVEA